ncbi:hypothetical protein AB6Q85_003307 [Vibrio cholerae]
MKKNKLNTRIDYSIWFKLKGLKKEAQQIKPAFLSDDDDQELLESLINNLANQSSYSLALEDLPVNKHNEIHLPKLTDTAPHYLYHMHYPEDKDNLSKGYIGVSHKPLARAELHKVKGTLKKGSVISVIECGTTEYIYAMEQELRPEPLMGWNINKGGKAVGGRKGRGLTYASSEIKENCYRRFKSNYTLYKNGEPYHFNYISHFAREIDTSPIAVSNVVRGLAKHIKGYTLNNEPVSYREHTKTFIIPDLYTPQGEHLKDVDVRSFMDENPEVKLFGLKQLHSGVVKSYKGYRTQPENQSRYITSITLKNIKSGELISANSVKDLSHIIAPRDVSNLLSGKQKTSKGYVIHDVQRGARLY